MARKRTLNRMDYRNEEGEETEGKAAEEEETDDEEEGDEEEEGDAEADVEAEADPDADEEAGSDDDDEDAPKPVKKKKAKAVKKPAAPKRTRAPKFVRMKAIWVVFDNSSKEIGRFSFAERQQADELVELKNTDKKGFYLRMVKVPFEE